MKAPGWPAFDLARTWREKLNRPFRFPSFTDPAKQWCERYERDRRSAAAAGQRIGGWPAARRRNAARLTLRCPSCHASALVIYRVDGRLLVVPRGSKDAWQPRVWMRHADGRRTPLIEPGFHEYRPKWLKQIPNGQHLPEECKCKCRRWRVTGQQLRAALPHDQDTPRTLALPLTQASSVVR